MTETVIPASSIHESTFPVSFLSYQTCGFLCLETMTTDPGFCLVFTIKLISVPSFTPARNLPHFPFPPDILKMGFFPPPLQEGFFERAKHEDKVPTYSAVRIRGGERGAMPGNDNWKSLEKKKWMATWHDEDYYS